MVPNVASKRWPVWACLGVLAFAPWVQAAPIFKLDNATNLDLGGSWNLGTPPGATDTAVWDSTSGVNTAAIGSSISWLGIQLTSATGTNTIGATPGGILTLGTGGIDMSTSTGSLAIAADVMVVGAQSWNVNAGQTLTVTGIVSGGWPLTLNNGTGGTVVLSGANTMNGGLTLAGGLLQANTSAGALGTGTLTLTGGTLDFNHSAALNFGRNTTISGNTTIISEKSVAGAGVTYTLGTLSIGAQTLNVQGGNVTSGTAGLTFGATTLTGSPTFNITAPVGGGTTLLTLGAITNGANTVTLTGSGNFAQTGVWGNGAGGLTLDASYTGTATLNQANTFTGDVVINGGIVKAGNAAALGAAGKANPAIINGGTLDVNGTALNGYTNPIQVQGTGVGGNGAIINTGGAQINALLKVTMTGDTKFTGANRFDIRGGTSALNMGGFTLTTAVGTAGTYMGLVGTTVSNPGNIIVSGGGLNIETGTTLGGTSANSITVNTGAFLGYYQFTGTDAWTHVMQDGSRIQTNSGGATTVPVAGPFVLNGAVTAAPTGVDTLNLSGLISGVGGWTMTGAGNLTLSGANNTFSGGTTVNSGTVTLSAAKAGGTGPNLVNGGTMTITAAGGAGTGSMTVNAGTLNANVVGALGNIGLTQTGGTVAQSVANAFTGPVSLTLLGGQTNLTAANSHVGGTTISGTNVTTVSAAGGLSGTTIVAGGTLISTVTTAPANNGALVIAGGLVSTPLAGGQYQSAALSASGVINPGGVGTVGTAPLTVNGLATTGGTLQFDVFSPTLYDQINSTGYLNVGAGSNIGFSSGVPAQLGNYKLIQYAGAAPAIGNFVLPAAPSGLTYSLSTGVDAGFIDLVVAGAYAPVTSGWLPTGTPGPYSWSASANWSGGVVPQYAGDTANFNSALTGSQAVTVDGQQHVGTLTLNPSAAFAYTINQGTAGSRIYLDNGASDASLQNLAQNNTIAAPIALASANTNVNIAAGTSLTLTGTMSGTGKLTMDVGTGTLNLNGTGAWTGGTEIKTGTIAINAVNGTASQINNAGVGTITLNGGTLRFTATTLTTTPPAGFAVVVGPGGGTLWNDGAVGTAGKLNMVNVTPNWLTGSGMLTKGGVGVLQTNQPNLGFTGNIIANGQIEVQNVATLGFGTTTGFTGGSLTVNTNGDVIAGGLQIFNPVTLNGGTLSADSGSNRGIFNSTVAVSSASSLRASQFYQTNVAENFAVKTLTGSANLAVNGSTTANAIGMVTLGNASGYTGTITIGANAALGIGSSGVANFFGNSNVITLSANSSGIGLVADGDGTSTPQTINFTMPTNPIAFAGGANTTGYIIGKQGATTQFNQEANKTIRITDSVGTAIALPYNNTNVLNVQPFNGYGLLLSAQPALTATTTFGVGNVVSVGNVASPAQASNVVPGLTLQNLSGAFGIVKSGAGTLVLGSGNTFGGAGLLIDITGGVVAAASDADLGDPNTAIRLNVNSGTQGFRALGTYATNRTFTLNQAANAIDVSGGNTLTLNTGLNYAAVGNALQKNEAGTLILMGMATGGPTSATTISGGALQISASNQIGTGTITSATTGGSLLLSNSIGTTFTQAMSLSGAGISGTRGSLSNVSGPNLVGGAITITGATLITNEDTTNTFTLRGAITNTGGFNAAGPGSITIRDPGGAGNIAGAGAVNAAGPGELRITVAITGSGALQAFGPLTLSESGKQGTGGIAIGYGGTLTFDNSLMSSAMDNRNNNHTLGMNTGGGATLNVIGSPFAATTETFVGVNYGRGENVIQLTPDAAQSITVNLTNTGGTFTRNTLSSVVYQAPGLGSAAAAGVGVINQGVIANTGFIGAVTAGASANQQIQPWALAYNTTAPGGLSDITFATASGATGQSYRQLVTASETTASLVNLQGYAGSAVGTASTNATTTVTVTGSTAGLFVGQAVSGVGIPTGAYIAAIPSGTTFTLSAAATGTAAGVNLNYGTTGTNLRLVAAGSLNGNTGGNTGNLTPAINSLTLATGGSLTLQNTQTLTIGGTAGGGILATDTTSGNSISGGGILTSGANELDIHTVGNLTISSVITGGAGGTGVGLTKGESGMLTLSAKSFHTGQTVVNAGTLRLNAGNNTIQFSNHVTLGTGATLNLNGNSQMVTDLLSDATTLTGLGAVGGNSTVTGTAGATLVLKRDNTARTFTGQIGGAVALNVSGQNTWTLTRNQTYSGPTLINGATVSLVNDGALSNTSSLTLSRGGLTLDNTGSVDSSTRLPSSLGITMAGGTLTYIGRTQWTSAETIGAATGTAIAVTEGANTISVTQQTTAVSSATLTLGGTSSSISRSLGATINFANTNGTLGTIGSNPQILMANAPTLSNDLIGGGFTVNGNDFASYNPTYGVGALGTTGFAGYSPLMLNNAASTDNVSNGTSTAVAIGNMTINSLRATGTVNVIQNAGTTLTVASGGVMGGGGALTVGYVATGTAANQGYLTSGGSELFLLGGTNSTVNSAITGVGMSLVKSGSNTWTINGTNTYTGGTYVNQGTLTLGNAGNVTTGLSTLGTGGIFLNGGTLTQTAGGVIPSQAVTVQGNGVLNLSSSLSVPNSVTTYGSNVITVPNTAGIAVGQLVTGTGIPGNEYVTSVNPANNTITITSGLGVTAQTATTLAFLVNNTLSDLTFNNNGGATNPTVAVTGVLTLSSGAITASSSNVGSNATLSGGAVNLDNVASPTVTVNPIAFNGQNLAPYQPTLVISAALQNANNPLLVTGGGNLQLSGASNFTGGVNLAGGTSLTIGANSTNMASGAVLTGPLGTGTLTIGAGSTLYPDAGQTRAVNNNVVVSGNFTFDAPSAAAATLTLGGTNRTITLPSSTATTITVNAPNMTGAFGGVVTGSGATIVKAGLGTLQLSNGVGGTSSFSGGVVVNAGTLLATGIGASGTSLGSGSVTSSGGLLQFKHSGTSSNGMINFGTAAGNNGVNINTAQNNAFIDVNNNGANTGNTIILGNLDYGTVAGTTFTSTVSGNPAPSTLLNVTGGNGYKLMFNATTLTSATSAATFNVGSGLTLVLNGGTTGFSATTAPTNVGPGTLLLAGQNTFSAPASITGTTQAMVQANASTTPLGTGGITLAGGSTLQMTPFYNGGLSNTGYTSGGLTLKTYFSPTGMNTATNWGIAPGSTLLGVQPNDSLMRQSPIGVVPSGATTTMVVYQGLLNITTAGTYYFAGSCDDPMHVVIDGQLVQNQTGNVQNFAPLPITLSAGQHMITARNVNNTGGGTLSLYYAGPDTAGNNITGLTAGANNYQALNLSAMSYASNFTSGNNYQNAAILNNAITVAAAGSATIDGLGTDFHYAIPSLTMGAGSTLTVANGTGTAVGSEGNGVFIVTGATTVSAGTATISPTTGTIVLAGGVVDGGAGLTKTGAGNLILDSSTLFTGPLNISGGFVQLASGTGLTTGVTTIGVATTTPATLDLNGQTVTTTGNIILNGGAGPAAKSSNVPAGLYNSSATTASLPAGGTLSIGAATAGVNASVGGFGDIVLNGVVQDSAAGSAWDKVGPNTLTLNGANTFTGALNIKAGMVYLNNASALGTAAGATVLSAGASLDLNGFAIGAEPVTLNGAGITILAAPNTLGNLINSNAAAASLSGPITLGAASSIGGPSLIAGVNGGITLSGSFTGGFALTKVGANNLTLTAGANPVTFFDVQAGSLTLSGNGAQTSTANSNLLRQGATLTLDNSGTAVSNRLGNHGLWLSGDLVINGNTGAAVTESVTQGGSNIALGATFGNGYGGSTITLNAAGTPGVYVSVASTSTSIFNRATGNTSLIRGTNLGNAQGGGVAALFGSATSLGLSANNGQSVGQTGQWNAPNALIYPWAVADQSAAGSGTGFASYSTYGGSANFGTVNTGGVAPISINSNNYFAAVPLSVIGANLPQNANTITVASTAGLAVGQLVTGTNLPANAVITAITSGTQFTISANTANVAPTYQTLTVYQNPVTTLSSTTVNANTTVTVTSTANLYPGQMVSGTGIASGTTIASITDATHFVLSANATAGGTVNLAYGLPGYANIVATGATSSFGLASVAQEINSLTLNNATGSTTTINTALQLDSGGVLALPAGGTPTYTISGGVLTGTNTLNRELIFHTVGAGTTLNVTAPIFTNGGGLTKADAGTLVLGSAETYTGDTVINGGTLKLNGGANTIFKVYTTGPTPGNAGAGVSGLNLTVNYGGTLDLNGNNQAVGALRSGSGTQLAGGTILNSNAGSPATLAIVMDANDRTWSGNISNGQTIGTITGNTIGLSGLPSGGTLNFVRDGRNTLTINSPNTLSGTVTIQGAATTLVDLGTFQNATAININRAALTWDDTGVQAVSNRLSSSAAINLTGGGLRFYSRAGTGSNPVDAISLGTLNLGVGASSIDSTTVNQGGVSQITFAGLGTRATGATVTFAGGNGGTLGMGDNPKVFFTSAPTVTNGLIGPWATVTGLAGTSTASFATYDPATGIRPLMYTAGSSFGSGVNTLVNAAVTLPAPIGVATTTTTNSVTTTGNVALSFTNPDDKLVVQSGGILEAGNNFSYGTTIVPGQIQSGAGNDLYFNIMNNTVTVNSKIIDNGSSNNVIVSGMATSANTPYLTLTNANTYGGTTYVSGVRLLMNSLVGPAIPGDVVLSGSNSLGSDSLAYDQTVLAWQMPNQLSNSANITMNGATSVNLGWSANIPNQSVPNTQTINNLTFNNDGGTNGSNSPTVFTGAGTLTIAGTINSQNNTEMTTIPTINGFIALTNASPTINVDANQYVPNQVGLAINANISTTASSIAKTGNGWLGIGGQSHNLVGTTFNVNAGGLAWNPTTGTVGAVLGSAVVMAANTTFDTRGLSGVLGSVASSSGTAVVMNGLQSAAGTLTTGLDNTSTAFAGTFSSPFATGLLNVTKIGTGTWTLTGDSSVNGVSGTFSASLGNTLLQGPSAKLNFQTYALPAGGTLTLDNTASALSNRLGGQTYVTANTLAPVLRTLSMQGGNLIINGNSSVAVSEALGTMNLTGDGTVTLNTAGTAGVNLTLAAIGGQGANTSLLIRGDSLGNAAGAGVATVRFATAGAATTTPGLTYPGTQGGGANNTFTKSIRPDILVSSSATGLGDSFLTVDSVSGLIRPLNPTTELQTTPTLAAGYTIVSSTINGSPIVTVGSTAGMVVGQAVAGTGIAANSFIQTITDSTHFVLNANATATADNVLTYSILGTTQNVKNSAVTPLFANATVNSMTLNSGGGFSSGIVPGNNWGPNGAMLTLTAGSGGILSLAGTNSIAVGAVATGGVTADYTVVAGTLSVNAFLTGTARFLKAGDGTLILNQPQVTDGPNAGPIAINGGTLVLNGGNNTLWAYTPATIPGGNNLAVNKGTLDLNGNNQMIGQLSSANTLAYAGGTSGSPNAIVTNTSLTTSTLYLNPNGGTTYGGVITGNLNLDKAANQTLTLTSPSSYTGTTTIRGGSISLRDAGALTGTSSIALNYAELTIDNTGFSTSTSRIGLTPVTMTGGALRFNTSSQVDTTNLGTITLNGGSNLFYIAQYSNNGNCSSPTYNIANVVWSNNATLNIEAPYNGALGNFTNANAHVYVSQVNGVPYNASMMVNGIMAPWLVVSNTGNAFNWATYSNIAGVTIPNSNGTPNYGALGGGVTANASINANATGTVGQTLNTLAILNPAAGTTLGMNGTQDQLVLAAGGLLVSNSANQAVAIQGGSITAGQLNAPSTLYLHAYNQNTLTINSPLVNNGTGALSIVRAGNMTVTLNPQIHEAVAVPAAATTTLTVPSSVGLAIGMGVSGTNITAGTTISSIAGNVLTLSTATTAGTAGTYQLLFSPVQSSATGATTIGTNTVTVAAGSLPAGFTPAVGMTLGSSVNIPGGTTITNVSGSGPWTLTLSQNATATSTTATLLFNPVSNTYTGSTTINANPDQYAGGTTNLSGSAGSVVIPGDLAISGGATVTMNTNQGQIAATSNVTFNGSGTLNMVGTNTLNSVVFNNAGGNATPTLAVGTLLNLSSATPITVVNDNTGATPTISGTTLNLANAGGAAINVSGLSPTGLIISAAINSAGTITKTGGGSLILPSANAASLTWNLAGGSLILNNATALGAAGSTLTISGATAGLQAGTAALTVATPITFAANTNLTLGNSHGNNNITLSGAMNLGGNAVTFTDLYAPNTNAISGVISNSTLGITKAGAGPLTLSGANTFSGPITVTGGLLTMGNASAFGGAGNVGADYTVAAGAEINVNANALSIGSLAGGGIVTNSGAVQTLTIGAGSNATNATFSGSLTAATQGNLAVTKTGTNNQTFSGTSYYTGATTINGGTLTLKNGGTLATTPTLFNTAISVASDATLAVSAAGANPGTANTVNIGSVSGTNSGASLTLNAGATASNFTMQDNAIGTFNILQGSTFAGSGLTIGGAGAAGPVMTFEIGSTLGSIDTLNVTKGVTVGTSGGQITIVALPSNPSLALGDYTFMTGASGLGVSGLTLSSTTITIGDIGYRLSLAKSTATTEILTVTLLVPAAAYWTGSQDAFWNTQVSGATNFASDPTGLTPNAELPGKTTDVFFTANSATNMTTTLGQDFTIKSLTFTGTGTANTAGSTIGGTNSLTINGATGITVQAGSGPNTISAPVILGASQSWTNNSANALTVSGGITGAGKDLTTGGTGRIVLTANSSGFTGNLTVSGGVLRAESFADALGTGQLILNAGQLQLANNANLNFGRNTVLGGDTQITVDRLTAGAGVTHTLGTLSLGANVLTVAAGSNVTTGTAGLDFGAVTLTGNGTINTGANALTTLASVIGSGSTISFDGAGAAFVPGSMSLGAGGVAKAGLGTLILSGNSTFTGSVAVNAGVVRAETDPAALGAGDVHLNGGQLQLANDTGLNFGRNTLLLADSSIVSDRLTTGAGVTHNLGTLGLGANTLTISTGANVTSGTAGVTFGAVTLTGSGAVNTGLGALTTLASVSGSGMTLSLGGAGDATVTGSVNLGTGAIVKTGTGNVTLNDFGNAQVVDVQSGTLTIGKVDAIQAPSGLVLGSGSNSGIFKMNGFSQSLFGLTTSGTGTSNGVINGSPTMTALTLDVSGANVFGGSLGSGTPGPTDDNNFMLIKRGAGSVTLSTGTTHTYTGTTDVEAGALIVNGSYLGGGAYHVLSTATLGGHGTVNANVSVDPGGFLSPGNSIGTFTITGNAIQSGTLVTELDAGAAGQKIDLLVVGGTYDIGNATVDFNLLSATPLSGNYVFAQYGALAGTQYSNVVDLPSGYTIDYAYGGNQIALTPVPEPGSIAGLTTVGLFGLAGWWRRRRKKAAVAASAKKAENAESAQPQKRRRRRRSEKSAEGTERTHRRRSSRGSRRHSRQDGSSSRSRSSRRSHSRGTSSGRPSRRSSTGSRRSSDSKRSRSSGSGHRRHRRHEREQ